MCRNECSNHYYLETFLDKYISTYVHETCRKPHRCIHIHLKSIENVFPCYVKKEWPILIFGSHTLVLYLWL